MLSYQHIFHAGNLADVQKHALLAWVLAYLTRKDKPLSYLETHAGRALYDLASPEAVKTREAASGIEAVADWFADDHPYAKVVASMRLRHGDAAYAGSPLLAAEMLRACDSLHLAELHPRENAALREAMQTLPKGRGARIYQQDGFELALSLAPPTPRRGLLLIDPSYEVKDDYAKIPKVVGRIHKKWNVGVIALWYPILTNGAHAPMIAALEAQNLAGAERHEVRFPAAREGHRMVGSGMFVVNAPFGLAEEAQTLAKRFATLM